MNITLDLMRKIRSRAEAILGLRLSVPSLAGEINSAADRILEQKPWQSVVSVAPASNGGWHVETPLVTAYWATNGIPKEPRKAFVKKERGDYIVAGIYDATGFVYQRQPEGRTAL